MSRAAFVFSTLIIRLDGELFAQEHVFLLGFQLSSTSKVPQAADCDGRVHARGNKLASRKTKPTELTCESTIGCTCLRSGFSVQLLFQVQLLWNQDLQQTGLYLPLPPPLPPPQPQPQLQPSPSLSPSSNPAPASAPATNPRPALALGPTRGPAPFPDPDPEQAQLDPHFQLQLQLQPQPQSQPQLQTSNSPNPSPSPSPGPALDPTSVPASAQPLPQLQTSVSLPL